MNVRTLLISSALAGVVIAIFSTVPFVNLANCLACLWVWVGGFFGAWFYRRSEKTLTPGQGAIVGALSGLFGAIVLAILGVLLGLAFSGLATIADSQSQSVEDVLGSTLASFVFTGVGSIISFLLYAFLFPIFGAISGALYGAIVDRQKVVV